ncbi:sugar kinase [Enterococcus faecalis]|uniref:sugar kinase n=1 Tax=Enterococcus faecalis TaxID=1351 RepID=UPI0015732E2B|nr:sugar kinase [Enterococcus faecalis]MCV6044586.1 sugar kinase [Enterococcus faecalis]NSR91281.1 sugar kinase [Enterococcus faecalis]
MKIAAFGEVMLRFTPPEYLMLEQTEQLRMNFVGTGVNLLANLAHFQLETALITKLPANRLGEAGKAALRKLGISDQWVGEKGDHIGSFFAEMGYGIRPTQVTYQNRHQSAFGISEAKDYDFEAFLAEVDMVHICGISLSLTEKTRDAALILAQKAHACQKKVCFDFNYRPSLNTANSALFMRQQYERILPYCDIVFGSRRDLVDLLGFIPREDLEGEAQETELIQRFMSQYNLEWFAGTTRSHSQNQNYLSGYLYTQNEYQQSEKRPLLNLDRIGAGDAYAAGILYGYSQNWSLEKAVTFATVNGVLAHTIQGDIPLTTVKQVNHVLEHPNIDLIR